MTALADLVRSASARSADAVVADARTASPTADVLREAEEVARELALAGERQRAVVAVVLPASVEAVTHLLAAVLADHVVCFLDPADRRRADAVLNAFGPDVVVDRDGLHPQPPGRRRPAGARGGYVAMSSGSTGGGPKGVLTTWACLADFAPHGAAALDVGPGAAWAEPNHPSYDLALTNWLVALTSGASLHVSGSLADRVRPLAFVQRRGATHVRLAPGYIDLAAAEAARGTPCGVRVWGSGGDRLTPERAVSVLGSLGAHTLVNTYGTSETAGFASAAAYASVEDLLVQDGSVSVGSGRLGPWHVELVADDVWGTGSDVIAVHSPHVGSDYLFGGGGHAYPRWEPGRVVTGDRGVVVDGGLFCLGRVGRLVKRSAGFVNLDDVDTVLRGVRGVDSFTVATRAGLLVTLVEGGTHPLDAVREELASRLSPAVLPDWFVPVVRLPRLGNGKADHAGALELAERALEAVD